MALSEVSAEQIEARLHAMREKSGEYAKAHARAMYLEEFRKSKKAMLMKQAERDGVKAIGSQEAYAYAHADYQTLLDDLETATEIKEQLRWEMEIAKLSVGVWQTMRADERQERRAYGS